MANIGPAYSFYFGFAGIVLTAGIAAPLVLVAAIIAIALLGNTLSQFSRAHPSTGGFITFVGKTFGGTSAVTTALLCGAGYIIAIASVLVISGGFLSMMIQYYLNVSIPWIIFSAAFTAGAMVMMFRGVAVSTKLAGFFFGFELLVLLVVAVAALIKNGGHLSARAVRAPATSPTASAAWRPPSRWASTCSSAGRTRRRWPRRPNNPRRNVPRAVFMSIALMAVTYLLVAYATVTGFGYNDKALTAAAIPFISVAHSIGGLAGLHRLPGRADLHPGRAHRRGELAVPADLQRRPRGPAAALDRPGAPGPPDAGQRHHHLRRASPAPSPWSGPSATGSAGTATAWTR